MTTAGLLASYCDDQDIDRYTYKHDTLTFAENPYAVGDYVVKSSHDDPDMAVVVDVDAALTYYVETKGWDRQYVGQLRQRYLDR